MYDQSGVLFAREYYTIIREFPTGKGFADLCFIPRKMHADKPAVVIELKWENPHREPLRRSKTGTIQMP